MAPNLAKGALDVLAPLPDGDEKLTSPITLEASTFFASGHPILRNVPTNVVATPSPLLIPSQTPTSTGCFVGFEADEPRSRHVVPIGQLMGIRFTSIFRFKVWWTTHWTGNDGNDVENETQLLILDRDEKLGRPYVLLLPIIEGPFRACLQSGKDNHVAMCIESGSTRVVGSSFLSCLYMQVGDDPFDLVRDAMKAVRVHLGTFKLLEEKSPPGMVDKFGWCTWDAFYLKVHPKGIWEGVKGLEEGGCPPGFVLIDDGWQSIRQDKDRRICGDEEEEEGMDAAVVGEQMPCRLASFQENSKFKEYTSRRNNNTSTRKNEGKGMGAFVRDLKEEFKSIEHVYVWHALLGYWGGIRSNVSGMPDSRVVVPKLSQGLQMTMKDLAVDRIVDNGVGLVSPQAVDQMYEGLHSHLESVGIDGVKVDVIHLLEMLSEDYGGRVELAKAYYKALTASINKHFKGNGAIASMEHCNDFMLLGTEAISLGRVGDDFWCSDPRGDPNGTYWLQGCHMVHCAYNSLWMGNFILPDWDMFQSTHPCAEFHAASRSISGGPIYVSDCVGQHNFELLKKLVLPDGSILRCRHYALPTRDCLFEDPLHDGKTLLKIWNLNRFTGVIGAFNCQGGGWCPTTRENKSASEYSHPVAGSASPSDVEWNKGNKQDSILIKGGVDADALFAVYMFKQKKLELLRPTESIDLTLDCFDFELLTVSPVHVLDVVTAGGGKSPVQFAPIGLVNMLNSGGAIQDMEIDRDAGLVRVEVRGCGEMKVFVSERPKGCRINGKDAEFVYDDARMATVYVSWTQGEPSGVSVIDYLFC